MTSLLDRIARAAAGRWKRSLAIVAVIVVALGTLAGTVGGEFADEFSVPDTDSQAALDLLQDRFPEAANEGATIVFSTEQGGLEDPAIEERIQASLAEVAADPDVAAVTGPYGPVLSPEQAEEAEAQAAEAPAAGGRSGSGAGGGGGQAESASQISPDGAIGFAAIQTTGEAFELDLDRAEAILAQAESAEGEGLEVSARGPLVDLTQQQTAPVGELIGIAVAVIVLTLVFRSVAAMVLTLVSAIIALAVGMILLTIGASLTTVPSIAPTLATMLGLGAGIDYALLIVGRYREHLAAGEPVADSAAAANRTAGTSVVAAGAIVAVAIAGLLATGIPFVGRMGLASAVVVACVAVGAITLLPVLMGAFAKRLRPKDPSSLRPSARFARWGERLTGHPWIATLAGTTVLVVLALPFTDLRLGQPDDGNDPAGSESRVAYDQLAAGFGPGTNGPLVVAVSLSGDPAADEQALGALGAGIEQLDTVAAASPPTPNPDGDAAVISVTPTTSPQSAGTSDLVSQLRDDVIPPATEGTGVEAYVGGQTATFEDLSSKISDRLPVFVAIVVGLSILLLMAVFRSLWVPLVSAVFNLLSIGAAYGIVVAVFQWGWGLSLFGADESVPIVSFIPLFMFAVLFGLSMDYNVFLQSRIREEYLHGNGARESIVRGLARVARIILAAGAIMTAVFLGFVTDDDIIVKMIGFGLAVAILIDVLIVRMVVAPAVMALLGDRAWGLPRWLDRLLPNIALEVDEELPATAPQPAASDRDRHENGSDRDADPARRRVGA
ncbi:MMPL family transporter [Thermoleophilia bacterium SCSIO 60948]|nr:MMPL family transporter [Thermoleophilia bacterium SCSIO 60948]